ncbi:MAG: class I SAM-dependent methyltransferase [Actinomycetes bacterium]
MHWTQIPGWFRWRDAQEEAAEHFGDGSRFLEVGTFLGRSICSLAEVAQSSGKDLTLIGVDTCRGSGVEGPVPGDYHGPAVAAGGGTFAGQLHRNIVQCGYADVISLVIADSVRASTFFPDQSLDWVHLDANHDREHLGLDIGAWLPKVKPGGWLSGDDYDTGDWPQVVETVNDLLPQAQPWCTCQWRLLLADSVGMGDLPPCSE